MVAVGRKSLKTFLRELDAFEDDVMERRLLRLTKRVAFTVLRGVMIGDPGRPPGTPVDRGQARGEWILGTAEAFGTIGRLDPSGSRAIVAARGELAGLRPYQRAYLTNNAPYIDRLERGHSPQNTAFIEAAVEATKAIFRTAR